MVEPTPQLSYPWLSQYPAGVPEKVTPSHQNALSRFHASVASAPERAAILYFDRAITYRELDRISDALAVALLERGFIAGDRLAIYLQNTPQFLIAVLATWKLGGIAVTINPMNREYEVAKLLADAQPRAMICLESLRDEVLSRLVGNDALPPIMISTAAESFQSRNDPRIFKDATRKSSVGNDDLETLIERYMGQQAPWFTPATSDIAFLVYTSGTTGLPKGAMITHGNVVYSTEAIRAWYDLAKGSPILAVAPLFHITGLVAHMALSWAIAAPLILCHRFDPGVVLDAIVEHRPVYSISAITAYIALMSQPNLHPEQLNSLKIVVSGGAPVPPSIVVQVEQKLGWHVHNGYGLTETSSGMTLTPHDKPARVDPVSGALSIGTPLSGVYAWICGENGEHLGHDEIGEIVLSGPTVSPGYWHKPEETAEAMREDGFRTGDVGFMDADGWFYIVDRKKDMINTSGFKVWPREVEDVLYGHPAVQEAAVVGVPDSYRGESVKAVVSLKSGLVASGEELTTWCRERLAAYKVPRNVEIIEALPKSAAGKILRRLLRDQVEEETYE
jgi:long-chain acyl-CoA synthetase